MVKQQDRRVERNLVVEVSYKERENWEREEEEETRWACLWKGGVSNWENNLGKTEQQRETVLLEAFCSDHDRDLMSELLLHQIRHNPRIPSKN